MVYLFEKDSNAKGEAEKLLWAIIMNAADDVADAQGKVALILAGMDARAAAELLNVTAGEERKLSAADKAELLWAIIMNAADAKGKVAEILSAMAAEAAAAILSRGEIGNDAVRAEILSAMASDVAGAKRAAAILNVGGAGALSAAGKVMLLRRVLANVNAGSAADLLWAMSGDDAGEAAAILNATDGVGAGVLGAADKARILRGMIAETAAALLEKMVDQENAKAAVAIFGQMDAEKAARIFGQMNAGKAARIFGQMDAEKAKRMFWGMDDIEKVVRIFGQINAGKAARIFGQINAGKAKGMFRGIDDVGHAVAIFEKMVDRKAAEIFEQMDAVTAAEILEKMNAVTAAEIFWEMVDRKAARIFEQMNAGKVARIFGQMDEKKAARIFEQMSAGKAAEILEKMNAVTAAEIFEQMSAGKAAEILEKMNAVTAAEIFWQMNDEREAAIRQEMERIDGREEAGILGLVGEKSVEVIFGPAVTAVFLSSAFTVFSKIYDSYGLGTILPSFAFAASQGFLSLPIGLRIVFSTLAFTAFSCRHELENIQMPTNALINTLMNTYTVEIGATIAAIGGGYYYYKNREADDDKIVSAFNVMFNVGWSFAATFAAHAYSQYTITSFSAGAAGISGVMMPLSFALAGMSYKVLGQYIGNNQGEQSKCNMIKNQVSRLFGGLVIGVGTYYLATSCLPLMYMNLIAPNTNDIVQKIGITAIESIIEGSLYFGIRDFLTQGSAIFENRAILTSMLKGSTRAMAYSAPLKLGDEIENLGLLGQLGKMLNHYCPVVVTEQLSTPYSWTHVILAENVNTILPGLVRGLVSIGNNAPGVVAQGAFAALGQMRDATSSVLDYAATIPPVMWVRNATTTALGQMQGATSSVLGYAAATTPVVWVRKATTAVVTWVQDAPAAALGHVKGTGSNILRYVRGRDTSAANIDGDGSNIGDRREDSPSPSAPLGSPESREHTFT